MDREQYNRNAREWRNKQINNGLCVHCSEPAEPGKRKCAKHMRMWNDARNKRRAALRAKGLCTECGQPVMPGYTRCERHQKENKQSGINTRQRRLDQGLCARCGNAPRTPSSQMCETCHLKYLAHDLWRERSRWGELKTLLDKQHATCIYSGRALRIGDNASIDHIKPVADGGTNAIGNLQWTELYINKMKLDRTEGEFVQAIKDIAEWHLGMAT